MCHEGVAFRNLNAYMIVILSHSRMNLMIAPNQEVCPSDARHETSHCGCLAPLCAEIGIRISSTMMTRQPHDLVCPTADPMPKIPDDLTVVQFILDSSHPTRQVRNSDVPWLIEDHSGRKIGFEEVSLAPP
jgi:hypothetical protein